MTEPVPDLPGLPRDADGPVFAEPWQAQAFALTVELHAAGHFTWAEWAELLGAEIATAGTTEYYEVWLGALERIVAERGLSAVSELAQRRDAWATAYAQTPHGAPVRLAGDDNAA